MPWCLLDCIDPFNVKYSKGIRLPVGDELTNGDMNGSLIEWEPVMFPLRTSKEHFQPSIAADIEIPKRYFREDGWAPEGLSPSCTEINSSLTPETSPTIR